MWEEVLYMEGGTFPLYLFEATDHFIKITHKIFSYIHKHKNIINKVI